MNRIGTLYSNLWNLELLIVSDGGITEDGRREIWYLHIIWKVEMLLDKEENALRLSKPKKLDHKPKPALPVSRSASIPGIRWIPSMSLHPANLLQLQQTLGNRAVAQLLQRCSSEEGERSPWRLLRAARKDGIEPATEVNGESLMQSGDVRYGEWSFHFVNDERTGGTAMYLVTLNNYKNRQRHVFIDAESIEPLDILGSDLDEHERNALMEWAVVLLKEQFFQSREPEAERKPENSRSFEEDAEHDLFAADADDEFGGSFGLAAAALLSDARAEGKQKGTRPQRKK